MESPARAALETLASLVGTSLGGIVGRQREHIGPQGPHVPLGGEGPHAIGFSLGARILLTVAAANPERFNRLVVAGVGTNLFERDEERGRRIAAAVGGEEDPEDPEARHFHALADADDIDRESLVAMMKTPRPDISGDVLSTVTFPVLVVLGDQDFAGPADPLVDALPDATLKTLRGVDHFATPKSFDFIDAGLEFLGANPF